MSAPLSKWEQDYRDMLRREPLWLEVLATEPAKPGLACSACGGKTDVAVFKCRLGWYEPTQDYITPRCAWHPVKPIPYMVYEARKREGEDPMTGSFLQSVINERYAVLGLDCTRPEFVP